ncbi:hypothetical protein WDW86_17525 [Bdellovibrionota bacterium FG-2]
MKNGTKQSKLNSRLTSEDGQGLTEYIMLMLLISVVSIGVTRTLGAKIKDKIVHATTAIEGGIVIANDAHSGGNSGSRGGGGGGALGGLGELAGGLFGE